MPLPEIVFQGTAQGTYYMVKYYDEDGRNFQKQIDSVLKDFDQSLSSWVHNSILSKVNVRVGSVDAHISLVTDAI